MVSKLKSREKCEHPIHLLSDVWRGEQAYVNAAGIPGTSQQRNVLLIPSLNSGGRQTSEIALIGSLTTKFWFLCSLKYCGFFFFFLKKYLSVTLTLELQRRLDEKCCWETWVSDLRVTNSGKEEEKKRNLGSSRDQSPKESVWRGMCTCAKGRGGCKWWK